MTPPPAAGSVDSNTQAHELWRGTSEYKSGGPHKNMVSGLKNNPVTNLLMLKVVHQSGETEASAFHRFFILE